MTIAKISQLPTGTVIFGNDIFPFTHGITGSVTPETQQGKFTLLDGYLGTHFVSGTFSLLDGRYLPSGTPVAWSAFTPFWIGLGVGNGTNVGAYAVDGKTIHWRIALTWGNTTIITGASVSVQFPVTAINGVYITDQAVGNLALRDVSLPGTFNGIAAFSTTTNILLRVIGTASSYADLSLVTATVPFTFTTSDLIAMSGMYERS